MTVMPASRNIPSSRVTSCASCCFAASRQARSASAQCSDLDRRPRDRPRPERGADRCGKLGICESEAEPDTAKPIALGERAQHEDAGHAADEAQGSSPRLRDRRRTHRRRATHCPLSVARAQAACRRRSAVRRDCWDCRLWRRARRQARRACSPPPPGFRRPQSSAHIRHRWARGSRRRHAERAGAAARSAIACLGRKQPCSHPPRHKPLPPPPRGARSPPAPAIASRPKAQSAELDRRGD